MTQQGSMSNLFDTESELIVLSSIFSDPSILGNFNVNADSFSSNFHKDVFSSMSALFFEDDITGDKKILESVLEKKGYKKKDYSLSSILKSSPSKNLSYYIDRLNSLKDTRKMVDIAKYILKNSSELSADKMQEALMPVIQNANFISDPFPELSSIHDIEEELPYFYLKDVFPIQKNEVNLISGDGGVGKSYLALYLSMAMNIKYQLKTFAFFSEDMRGVTKSRYNKLCELHPSLSGSDITPWGKETRAQPFVKKNKNSEYSPTSYWYKFIQKLNIYDLIIIDPLVSFIGDGETQNADSRYMFNLLNEWCVKEDKTVVFLHHNNALGNARGVTDIVNAARMHYKVVKGEDGTLVATLNKNNHMDTNEVHPKYTMPVFSAKKNLPKPKNKKSTKSIPNIDTKESKPDSEEEINDPYRENIKEVIPYFSDPKSEKEQSDIDDYWGERESSSW